MKKLSAGTILLSFIILFSSMCSIHAGQDDNAGRVKPPSGGSSAPSSSGGGKRKTGTSAKKANSKSASIELTIRTNLPGCAVLIEDQPKGNTDINGALTIRGLKPGAYTVTVRKQNFQEMRRVVEVAAGQKFTSEFILAPMPGTLSVTSTLAGVMIEVSNSGTYSDRVNGLSLSPGNYHIAVSKLGYRTATRDVEIKSAQPLALTITPERLSVEELLAQAVESYGQQNYQRTIALSRTILESQPNHAKANALMGSSLYSNSNFDDSIAYLTKAVTLGESISLPAKHRHGDSWNGKSLCSGSIILHTDSFEFNSTDYVDDNFRIPYSKIYEMSIKDQIRLSIKIAKAKPGGKGEERKEYNFYSPDAIAGGRLVTCTQCPLQMQAVLQLIRQIKSR